MTLYVIFRTDGGRRLPVTRIGGPLPLVRLKVKKMQLRHPETVYEIELLHEEPYVRLKEMQQGDYRERSVVRRSKKSKKRPGDY